MKVTIAICTYNRGALLPATLGFACAQEYPEGEWEVLVIDNASTDGTPEKVAAFRGSKIQPRYLLEARQGLSHARNRALQEARGEIVVFLDDDTEMKPDWLSELLEPYGRPGAERIGIVAGEVIPVFPESIPAWLEGKWSPLAYSKTSAPMTERQLPLGANFSTRRELALRLGGFRTDLGRTGKSLGGNEDHDFTRRVRAAGYEAWFVPSAPVNHLIPASRLSFGYTVRFNFDSSRSRVIERVDTAGPGQLPWLLSRLFLYSLNGVLLSVGSLLCLLVFQTGQSKRLFTRVAKAAGYVREVMAQIPRCLSGSPKGAK